jgi:TolB-like protein/DNA-binding SARP family transcriptional activator
MQKLRTFGGLTLEKDGVRLDDLIAQRKVLALLAVLARSGANGIGREKLMLLLWPESDMERARGALKQMLHTLRRQLSAPNLITGRSELVLDPDIISSDVGQFAEHLARNELEEAVNLYGGPFLDGVHIDKAPEFARWLDVERDELHRDYLGALEKLARVSESAGKYDDAVSWWRRYSAADPLDSRGAAGLMLALDAAGDRSGALRHAQSHQSLLESELGANPNADVAALAAKLRAESGPTHSRSPAVRSTSDHKSQNAPVHNRTFSREIAFIGAMVVVAAGASAFFVYSKRNRESIRAVSASTASPARTIAVLPFTNMSADSNEEYFSDGLTDELIGTLSQVRALRVASRTSSFAFKGQNRDIRSIGRVLNVGTVVEGSVRKIGNRVRVTAELVNTADGFHLWAKTYQREGTDVFAIQSDLALRIAGALETELTPQERDRISRPATDNDQAHTFYMEARYFALQRRSGSLAKAIHYYERAIAADPHYADAYAGLASVYPPLGVRGYISPWEGRRRMQNPAVKAVALDSSLAQAHTALGGYMYAYEWNWRATEREFQKAIELDRGEAHGWYSVYLTAMHRNEEAVREARNGIELEPLAAISYSQLGGTLVIAGHADQAIAPLNTAIELDSAMAQPRLNLALAYEALGKRDEALRQFQKAASLAKGDAIETAYFGRALVLAGREAEARHILDTLKAGAARTHIYSPHVALLFAALGETDAAVDWLEASARQRHPAFPHGVAEPAFASLRKNPRFRELLRRNGLPS